MLERRRFPLAPLAAVAALGLGAFATGCSDGSFHVERTPEMPRGAGAQVSVFGVYKDGRLAPEAFDPLRNHLSPFVGLSLCDPGYPDIVTPSGTAVLDAIDDFTRANGVTDELLDKLSVAAKGDLVLLITETGRPGAKADSAGDVNPAAGPPTLRAGGRRGGSTPAQQRKPAAESGSFEIVGVFFSVKAHKSVAAIRMSYGGGSIDDAFQMFFSRLGSEVPGATCVGWKPDLHIDVQQVRRLETQ